MKKLTANIAGRWAYVTMPDDFTWQVIPARNVSGYQVRVYRGKGKKDREMVALFHCESIREEGTIEISFDHPFNNRDAIVGRMGTVA